MLSFQAVVGYFAQLAYWLFTARSAVLRLLFLTGLLTVQDTGGYFLGRQKRFWAQDISF